MKRILIMMTTFALVLGLVFPTITKADAVVNEKLGVPIVVYGANLSDVETESVRKSLNVVQEDEVEEVFVNGTDLIKYIPDGDSKARMYSSAKITRQEAGKGLVIKIMTESNITQVTADMYANAMLTAGIQDAIVEIAAPKKVTGHSALVGIYKAYEVSGEVLDTERTDVANDELNLSTKFAEESGIKSDKVTELLTEIKKEIAAQKPATKEDIEKIVSEQLQKLEIQLSDTDRQLLIDLMDKIRDLNIDFGKLSDQLTDLNNKIKDKIAEVDPAFWDQLKAFFVKVLDTIKSWFE